MKHKRELRNTLIVCGLASLVLAPFVTYFLTPVLVNIHCGANPRPFCGLGEAPMYGMGIFLGLFFLGAILIAMATGIEVKEKKLTHSSKK